jgi:hypothetical protein
MQQAPKTQLQQLQQSCNKRLQAPNAASTKNAAATDGLHSNLSTALLHQLQQSCNSCNKAATDGLHSNLSTQSKLCTAN